MTDILLGRLYHVTRDDLVNKTEFKEVENAVFAGDGFVSYLEYEALFSLFLANDNMQFEDDSDLLRLNTILEGPALTLERYLNLLATQNLKTKLLPPEIRTLTKNHPRDRLPRLTRLDVQTDGSFSITLRDPKNDITWNYSQGDDPVTIIEKTFSLMQFELVYLTLVQAHQNALTKTQKDKTLVVIRTMVKIKRDYLKAYPNLQKTMLDMGFEASQNIIEQEYLSYLQKNHPSAKNSGWQRGTIRLFQEHPNQKKLARQIRNTLNGLPQGLKQIWENHGSTLAIRQYHPSLKKFLNMEKSNQDQEYPHTYGITAMNPPWPAQVSFEPGRESYSLYTALHELGHNLYLILDTASGGEWSSKSQSHGQFSELMAYAHAHQRREVTDTNYLKKFPTIYSATNPHEYFAECFAIYFLGKYAPKAVPSGLTGLQQYTDAGFDFLFKELENIDPFGFTIMTALDQMFIKNDKILETLKTGAVMDILAQNLQGKRRDEFLNHADGFANRVKQINAIQNLAALPSTIPVMAGLFDIDPAQWDETLKSSEPILTQLEDLLRNNPLDEMALTALHQLLTFESDNPHWKPVKQRCGQIILDLHMQNPHLPALFMLFVQSLMQRGKIEQAAGLLHDYAKDNPDSILVYEVGFLRAKCLIGMDKKTEATELLEKLVGDLLHPDSLLRRYPQDFPQLRVVLDQAVDLLVPLLEKANRSNHAEYLKQNRKQLLPSD